jgi:hypothetical protein
MMKRVTQTVIGLIAAMSIVPSGGAAAAEWGSLKGRFVVDGTPPKLAALILNTKDQYCLDKKPTNEEIVVGDDGSLANVVVYLRLKRGEKIEVHPDYAASLSKPVVLDNNTCHFVPHVTLARTGQTIMIKNSDPVGHNTNLGFFNQIIPAGNQAPTKISRAEVTPLSVTCNIHPFMKGYLLVQDHPYMAVSDKDGRFEIKNIPAGKHGFTFWHEASSFLKNLKVGGGITDRRGTMELTIKPGDTLDLGEIKVQASKLRASP